MGIQTKLANATSKLRRKLFDYQIKLTGIDVEVTRVQAKVVEQYSRGIDISAPEQEESYASINLKLSFPGELPLHRIRYTGQGDSSIDNTGAFFYEILPIEAWSRFTDEVNDGDYIIHSLLDENDNKMWIVLKIGSTVGTFDLHSLVWKKHFCEVYNGELPDFVLAKMV